MAVEQRIPSPGESITEVEIIEWLVDDGAWVEKDDPLCEIESEKVTLTMHADASGVIKILVPAGETVEVDKIACEIDTDAEKPEGAAKPSEPETKEKAAEEPKERTEAAEAEVETPSAKEGKREEPEKSEGAIKQAEKQKAQSGAASRIKPRKSEPKVPVPDDDRPIRREKISQLRRKVAERLVAVKNETAMLTTFNEVDMSAIIDVRKKYKERFQEQHGVKLGFMSFFVRAVCEAMHDFPAINAYIDGEEIVYHDYVDVGIAVSAPKGLMVPVVRNAHSMTFAKAEKTILDLAERARENRITLDELTGGTFTITNGGVFGSLLSTPILNPPQSAILGMHTIQERPVAVDGEVVIRPMMYVALSYDHRIVDGRESVGYLKRVKELLEDPVKLLLGVE